jgi:cytochrome c551/c552
MKAGRHTVLLLISLLGSALSFNAWASMNLALEKGCLNCHGTPPRGQAPTVAALAERYASARGNETEITRLSAHLREHHLFGGVSAHERLSAEEAEHFVRWLVGGGR